MLGALGRGTVVFFALFFFVGSAWAAPGARALEARLLAPCCWGGTLDVHESELATNLRGELGERLGRGESAESVQADFVARYGERVVAAESDRPIGAMTLAVLALLGAIGLGLGRTARRWTRNASGSPDSAPSTNDERELDQRIDRELEALEGAS